MKQIFALIFFLLSSILSADNFSGLWLYNEPKDESFYYNFEVVLTKNVKNYNDGNTRVKIDLIDEKEEKYNIRIYGIKNKGEELTLREFEAKISWTNNIEYRDDDFYFHLKFDPKSKEIIWSEGSNYAEVDWGIGILKLLGEASN